MLACFSLSLGATPQPVAAAPAAPAGAVVPFAADSATNSFSIHSCLVLRQRACNSLQLKTFAGFISDFCCCCCCCCWPGLLQDVSLGWVLLLCCLYLFYYLFVFARCPCPCPSTGLHRNAYLFAHYTRHHVNRQWPCVSLSLSRSLAFSLWHSLRSAQSQAMEQLV